ncbi:MAG: hypothetical protein ACFFDC_09480 [Promethearchaeota archaeon]
MYFPFSLKSASNWLDFVPELLLTLPNDSKHVNNTEFHNYLASTLETFFPEASEQFLLTIFTLLTESTDAGKYVILQTLLLAEGIWEVLAQDETFQPLLTGLALSTDKIYAKSAATFSSKLEEFFIPEAEEAMPELYEKAEKEALDEAGLDDILEGALEEISYEEFKSEATLGRRARPRSVPSPATSAPQPVAAPKPPGTVPAASHAAARTGPPAPKPASPPPVAAASAPPREATPPSPAPLPSPAPTSIKAADTFEVREKEVSKKRKKAVVKADEVGIEAEPLSSEESSVSSETMHTHVHYYSKMLSRKTYPLHITLSRVARELSKDKSHFLSGEKEKETRGEFELTDVTKRLVVEPLLSGCLVQPSSQFVDPRAQNLPKVLTFFVTPLVDAGFRTTSLTGAISVKSETGTVLLKLSLPDLAVTSHRVSKTAAIVGTVGGGIMPAFDLLFNAGLQVTLASQLATINPQLHGIFDMLWVVMGAQVLLFIIAITIALLWYWKKGRAKVAPDRASTLQLPQ